MLLGQHREVFEQLCLTDERERLQLTCAAVDCWHVQTNVVSL